MESPAKLPLPIPRIRGYPGGSAPPGAGKSEYSHRLGGGSEGTLIPSRGGSGREWGIVSGRSPRKDRGTRGNCSDPRQPPVTLGGRKGREGRKRALLRLVTNFFFKRESLSFTLPFTHPISSVQGKRGNPGLAGVHPETPVGVSRPHHSGIPACRKLSLGDRNCQGKVTRIVTRGIGDTRNQGVSAGPGLARGLHVIGGTGIFPPLTTDRRTLRC